MLDIVFYVKRIQQSDKSDNMVNIAKKEAQPVYPSEDELETEGRNDKISPFGDVDQVYKADYGKQQQESRLPFPFDQRND